MVLLVFIGIVFVLAIIFTVLSGNADNFWQTFWIVAAVLVALIPIGVGTYFLVDKATRKEGLKYFKLPNGKTPEYVKKVEQTHVYLSEKYICCYNGSFGDWCWFECQPTMTFYSIIHTCHSDAIENANKDKEFYTACFAAGLAGVSLVYFDEPNTDKHNCIDQITLAVYNGMNLVTQFPLWKGSQELTKENFDRCRGKAYDFIMLQKRIYGEF